jgi:hypothetical protein
MKLPENFKAQIAGNFYVNTPNLITCGDESILRVDRETSTGRLQVWMTVYDSSGRCAARIEDTSIVEGKSSDYTVLMTDKSYLVREKSTGRSLCEIRRSAAGRQTDIDVFVLTHGPDGFFIHANPKQSNTKVAASGKVHRDLDTALRLN